MKLFLYGHSFHYEMENLCRLFFTGRKIEVLENCRDFDGPDAALTLVEPDGDGLRLFVRTAIGAFRGEAQSVSPRIRCRRSWKDGWPYFCFASSNPLCTSGRAGESSRAYVPSSSCDR